MIADAFLRRLQASPLAPVVVLRGSALSAAWIPGRIAKDLDFLVEGDWTVASLDAACRALIALPDPVPLDAAYEPIWQETPWPGLRLHLLHADDALQIDIAFNEPMGFPPVPVTYRGFALRACIPEMMTAWKIHSLVERGPRGRWHAKTLADLVLLDRHLTLDPEKLRACVGVAFGTRGMDPLKELDGFLNEPAWGQSRGSRNKWKSYLKKAPWIDFALEEGLKKGREIVRAAVSPPATR